MKERNRKIDWSNELKSYYLGTRLAVVALFHSIFIAYLRASPTPNFWSRWCGVEQAQASSFLFIDSHQAGGARYAIACSKFTASYKRFKFTSKWNSELPAVVASQSFLRHLFAFIVTNISAINIGIWVGIVIWMLTRSTILYFISMRQWGWSELLLASANETVVVRTIL